MKILFIILTGVLLMSCQSSKETHRKTASTLKDGELAACGTRPNCVSSFADPDSKFFIEPSRGDKIAFDKLIEHIVLKECSETQRTENYGKFECKTKFFKFVDDLEIYFDGANAMIHFRSESRVGYSDFGKNRKRVQVYKDFLASL